MKKALLMLVLAGCAPLHQSMPKSSLCQIPSEYLSRYNSIALGDSWNTVQELMQEVPVVDGNTQTYSHCKKMVFTFDGNLLVSKEIK